MSLRDTLKDIIENVEGGLAAVIMGFDGIPIDEVTLVETAFDVQLLSVEYSSALKEIKKVVEIIKSGELEEVSITTGEVRVLVRILTDDLFVVLIMRRNGNFGKGRYLLSLRSVDLARELS